MDQYITPEIKPERLTPPEEPEDGSKIEQSPEVQGFRAPEIKPQSFETSASKSQEAPPSSPEQGEKVETQGSAPSAVAEDPKIAALFEAIENGKAAPYAANSFPADRLQRFLEEVHKDGRDMDQKKAA